MVLGPRTLKSRDIKILRFWVLGFLGFATYTNFEALGFQGLATIKILMSWVFWVSLHIKTSRSWVSKVLWQITILMSWVSRVPRQKGRARSKIHQGPRPWTQRTQDLESFWDLGTSLLATTRILTNRKKRMCPMGECAPLSPTTPSLHRYYEKARVVYLL